MKKTLLILVVVALLGILAASVAPSPTKVAISSGSSSDINNSTAPSAATSATTTPLSPTKVDGLKNGTYTGRVVSNRYDEIAVAIVIDNGKIASITTPTSYGDGGRSEQINSYAIPQLIAQTIRAQNSSIDGISGASYTTQAYEDSLQSAIDQAKA